MIGRSWRFLGMVLLSGSLAGSVVAQHPSRWVDSWGAAQQIPEPENVIPANFTRDFTLRQIVHLSLGGAMLRVRISNRFGTEPLTIDHAAIAKARAPGRSAIDTSSSSELRFGGDRRVIIPAGAEFDSDPISLAVANGANIAVTLHYPSAPVGQTGHPASRATSFLVGGAHVDDAEFANAVAIQHWYQLSDVAVSAGADARTIVAIGDSITDGHGATLDANRRWPDQLAERLRKAGDDRTAVINTGIGGNRVLEDGLGPNLLARFDRDALDRPGVSSVIVLEGVNDIGVLTRLHSVPAEQLAAHRARLLDGLRRLIERAHARGIRIYGATITPFVGSDYYHPSKKVDADRDAINAWIRTPGHFDGVIDFDKALRDPVHPERLLPAYDSGDHLHPSDAGYAAMAATIPLTIAAASSGESVSGGPAIAITFDDLPSHGPLPAGGDRLAIMSRISASLKAAGVPPTYGFTNGGFAANDPPSAPALAAWRADGNLLANHSWSHMNANDNTLIAWQADVVRDEAAIAPLMTGQDWHWLRFPYLAEGNTPAKRTAIRQFLSSRGYKIASVTMSFADYLWNEPYARCVATHDDAAIARLKRSYLDAAAASFDYSVAASRQLYGRDVPQVLLMHVGAFDAQMLPDLLALYRARGARFVSLAEAEADPFYRGDIAPATGTSPATFEAAAAARHVSLPAAPVAPAELATLCR